MSSFCYTSARKEDTDTIVGTSTNCSTSCGSSSEERKGSHPEVLGVDHGHVDNLLGKQEIELLEDVRQLFNHLRHRNVKRRHDHRAVDHLFHGAPQYPFLWPDLKEPVRTHSPELRHAVIVQESVACRALGVCGRREGGGGKGGELRIVAVKFISRSHSPAAIFGRCALWCNFSARAIATVIRSRLSHERSRRLIAAPSHAAKGCPPAIFTCRILANKGFFVCLFVCSLFVCSLFVCSLFICSFVRCLLFVSVDGLRDGCVWPQNITMQRQSLRLIGDKSLGSQDSWRLRHLPTLDNSQLRGLPKKSTT